ncbi:hypothetical protein, partial [Rhizobium oryzihabitans]|uniref:hypothetical protein n=1 Tax=Rhizobium oryzihabitans TaxID=2267833 RepID=UPI004036DBE6
MLDPELVGRGDSGLSDPADDGLAVRSLKTENLAARDHARHGQHVIPGERAYVEHKVRERFRASGVRGIGPVQDQLGAARGRHCYRGAAQVGAGGFVVIQRRRCGRAHLIEPAAVRPGARNE